MGFETLPHNDYLATLDHLANVGPISTSVAAGDWGMYFGGVFDGCDYESNVNVNHAVQLVIYSPYINIQHIFRPKLSVVR